MARIGSLRTCRHVESSASEGGRGHVESGDQMLLRSEADVIIFKSRVLLGRSLELNFQNKMCV